MKRFRRFFLTGVAFLALGYAYLGWSLSGSFVWGWIILAVPFVIIFSLPLLVWGRDRSQRAGFKDWIAHAAYSAMGVLTYLFVFTVLRDVLHLAGLPRFGDFDVFVLSFLALAVGAWIALVGPRVKRVEIFYPNLPPELDGFQIAQITDLHIGGVITRGYVRRVTRQVNALHADVVALTGDIGDGAVSTSRPIAEVLEALEPKGRVFYVPGNHEYYWGFDEWMELIESLGFQVLLNSSVQISARNKVITIAGIPDLMAAMNERWVKPDVTEAAKETAGADFKILLAHRPGVARRASENGFDLQLSGHTHGGQFFPWTWAVRLVHEFPTGLASVGKMWIYVSPGTGTWGPPLRLGTTPEISSIILRRLNDRVDSADRKSSR